ncbi:MAG: GNAT family N-acetyltransferase [Clostridiales bacterium]|nr:GNAT family N-acetyltransferase [Clostridiales bacterium]
MDLLSYISIDETNESQLACLDALWIPYMREIYRDDPDFMDTDEQLRQGARQRVHASAVQKDMFFELAYNKEENCVGFLFYAVDYGGIPGVLPPGFGYIMEVYTAPEYRRRGYAAQMYERMRCQFLDRNVSTFYLTPDEESGMPFWKAMGFADSGLIDPDNHMPVYYIRTGKMAK